MCWLTHIYFVFNNEIMESTVPQANLWICLRWCCEPSEWSCAHLLIWVKYAPLYKDLGIVIDNFMNVSEVEFY